MSEMKNNNPDGDSENRDADIRRETIDAAIWLDRLVDGEIDDDEQRQLLLALESQPDGWRRCALTFIESQTLRKDLAGVGNNTEVVADGGACVPLRVAAKRGRSNLASYRVRWFAMAACFVLAFVIGTLARGWLTSNSVRDGRGPSSQDLQVATNVGHQEPTAATSNDGANYVNQTNPNGSSQAVQLMAVTADGNSDQAVEVPLNNASPADIDTLLAPKKPLLSDAETKEFESSGAWLASGERFIRCNFKMAE